MNDIDFDELDRAITSAMQKDAAAAAPAKSNVDEPTDTATTTVSSLQPTAQPELQSAGSRNVQPSEHPKVSPSSKVVGKPAVSFDASQQDTLNPVGKASRDVEITPQEAAIVQGVLQEFRAVHHVESVKQPIVKKLKGTPVSSVEEAPAVHVAVSADDQNKDVLDSSTASAAVAVVDEHSPVPPLVLPERTKLARRTPSVAVHNRMMSGRSVSSAAGVVPPAVHTDHTPVTPAKVADVVAAEPVKPAVESAELSPHDKHMTEVMTTELKKAAADATAETTLVATPPRAAGASESKPANITKPAMSARAAHLNPIARDTTRRVGRFMDMVHPSSDMRHMTGVAAAAGGAAVVNVAEAASALDADVAMPDRTEQTSADKEVEDKVAGLLSGATSVIEGAENAAESTMQAEEESIDTASSAPPVAETLEVDDMTEVPSEVEVSDTAIVETRTDTPQSADCTPIQNASSDLEINSVATIPQPVVNTEAAAADSTKLDTETHPIFDTDSYMQPVDAELPHGSNVVWKVLGVVLVVLVVVAVVLLWQLSSI